MLFPIKTKPNAVLACLAVILLLIFAQVDVMADNVESDCASTEDSFNFTLSYTEYSLRTKSGHSSTVCYVDLQNGILVEVDEYDGRKNDHLYVTPYRLQVEEDGKVYRFQKNGALQEDYMMIEDGQCVNYNNEGEKVCSYEAHFFDTHLPTRLKKVGFFDEYPTPSSFLSSFKDEKKITEATSSDHIEDADGPNMVETDAFVLNIKSHKFHKPSCVTLNDMNQNDLQTVEWEREQVIEAGYEPCRRCNP